MVNANAAFRQSPNRPSQFNQTPSVNIGRSKFNLSHTHKGTVADGGYLRPFDLYEVLPGDTFKIKPTLFVRMTTQLYPVMDNAYLDLFYFWIPNRLLWTNWQRFMGERTPDPDTTIDLTIPQIVAPDTGWTEGSLADCFGLPTLIDTTAGGEEDMSVSALPFRAYNLIFNEWFRNQLLTDGVVVDTDDGPDAAADYASMKRRTKRLDYFTSALPEPQKGGQVDLPLGDTAPVNAYTGLTSEDMIVRKVSDDTAHDGGALQGFTDGTLIETTGGLEVYIDPSGRYYTDLSTATAATINDLREAFQIQKVLERDNRGGTRYFELIQSHFGVTDPSSLVPTRPEFLGGSSTRFNQATVAQTTFQGTETRFDAKGALAANSVFISDFRGVTKSFTEHGYIMGIFEIRTDNNYQQGIDRHFLRSTRYDYYLPSFAHLGEQAIESRELYFDGSGSSTANPPTGDYSIFGYVPRFDELRFSKNIISGMLKSDSSAPLDFMHYAQDFASRPTLNNTFINDTPPFTRNVNIVPSHTAPAFIFDSYVEVTAVRAMPSHGTPGLIDHF